MRFHKPSWTSDGGCVLQPYLLAAGARVKDKVFLLQSPFSRTYCPHKILLDHKIFHLLYSSNDLKIEISLTVLSNIREVCLKENHLVKGCEIILEIVAVKKVPKIFIPIYNIHKHSQICILIFVYQKFFWKNGWKMFKSSPETGPFQRQ